jgi:hypothetical protein
MQTDQVQFEDFKVYRPSPGMLVAYWTFRPTIHSLEEVSVKVFRSDHPESGFEEVGEIAYPQTYFVDQTANQYDFWRQFYYKVTVVVDDRTIEAGPAKVGSDAAPMTEEMVRQISITLRFGGEPVFVYMKIHGEVRCPNCWDPALKKVTRSKCPTCFATGWLGGFRPPVLTCGLLISEAETDHPDQTSRQPAQTTLRISNFPEVRSRDIIREVNSGEIWRIVNVSPVRMHDYVTHQNLTLKRLVASEVEHSLPIPENLDFVITPHWAHVIRPNVDKIALNDPEKPIEDRRIWR